MRIMVLSPYLPHQRVGHGGGTAVRDLLKHLAVHHDVLLVSLVRSGEEELVQEIMTLGVQVAPLPFRDAGSRHLSRLGLLWDRARSWGRSLVSGYPPFVEKYWSPSRSRRIIALIQEFQPEAIQVEYLQMSLYIRDFRRWRETTGSQEPRLVLNTHELGSVPRQRRAAHANRTLARWWFQREARQWIRLQVAASHWADRTLCVTAEDRKKFQALGGVRLLTVPLGMDLASIPSDWHPESPPRCLFVGSFHHRPNVLAAHLLVESIWPEVRAQRPDAQLILVGRGSRESLPTATEGVTVLGFVDDLQPLFRTCGLFVAPLTEGGGIKIKILEAMARGIPVVTTTIGAEGIATAQDETLVIVRDQADFAAQVVKALNDPQSASRAARARRQMEREFSWAAIAERLSGIYRAEE